MSKSKLSFSSEGKADDSDGFLEKSADERIFDGNLERFRSTAMPEMDNLAPIKERISTMEESMATQTYMNDLTGQLFHNLDTDLSNKEMNLQRVILQLEDNFRKEMDAMKKDYDHRFDLQCAENQRLQQHISTLKAETNQIHRKLNVTIQKLQQLQNECGVRDDWEDLPGEPVVPMSRVGTASSSTWQNSS